jgi:hypothetical protein
MKSNSVNLYSISKGVFKPTRIKDISLSLSLYNCMKDIHRLFRMTAGSDVCKEKSLSSALYFAICPWQWTVQR